MRLLDDIGTHFICFAGTKGAQFTCFLLVRILRRLEDIASLCDAGTCPHTRRQHRVRALPGFTAPPQSFHLPEFSIRQHTSAYVSIRQHTRCIASPHLQRVSTCMNPTASPSPPDFSRRSCTWRAFKPLLPGAPLAQKLCHCLLKELQEI